MGFNMKLQEIFEEMQIIAEENQQLIPQKCFVSDDKKIAYVEIINQNPIVMANKVKGKWMRAYD